MNLSSSPFNKATYYRLIALWVLCEAMLGGLIHALKIPVSGLVVGSAAVICICLIAFYAPGKGNILRATVIVAVFKMLLSPQAPVGAYFAVFFQGVLAELLFWNKKFYRFSCILLGLFALVESGLQRILVLTIVYGNNLWKAINDFMNNLSGQKSFTNYSLYLAIGYVVLHVIVGLIVGWWAGVIPSRVSNWSNQFQSDVNTLQKTGPIIGSKGKHRWMKRTMVVVWIVLILLYLQSYFRIGSPLLSPRLPLQILIRSVIIILTWYFIIGPLLAFILKKWLERKRSASTQEVAEISLLLPSMKAAMSESWKASSSARGINRIIFWGKLMLVYVLYPRHE